MNIIAVLIKQKLYYFTLISVLLFSLLQTIIPAEYFVYLILYILILFIFKENIAIVAAITTILSITSIFGESVRLIVQLNFFLTFLILTLIKYYQKNISLPDFPVKLFPFLYFLFGSLFISTILSSYALVGVISIGKYIVFFSLLLLLYLNINNLQTIRLYIYGMFLAGFIISLGTIIDLSLSGFSITNILSISLLRTGGFIENVNAAGGFFAILIPLSYIFYLIERNKSISYIYLFALAVFSLGIVITNSRAAFLSILISFIVFLFNYNRQLLIRLSVITSAVAVVIIIVEPFNEFFSLLLRIEDGLSHREPLWEMTTGIIKDNFLFGVGPGAYAKEMFNHFPVMLDSWQGLNIINLFEVTKGANVSHNFYVAFLSDMGIPGLVTSIMLPFYFIKISVENISFYKSNRNIFLLNLGIISIASGLFIRAFFDSVNILSYGYITNDLPFWILFLIIIYFNTHKLKLINAKF
jgi:O-antigen ligase